MAESDVGTRAAIHAAYRATGYRARGGGVELCIRIGRAHPELDALCRERAAERWAWLTAANPMAQRLSPAENARRHRVLRADIRAAQCLAMEGEARADAGDWPDEAGLLVFGISSADARALARKHGQEAFVAGCAGGEAELLFCACVT